MTVQDFIALVDQMRRTSVPRRLIFLWRGPAKELENLLEGIEINRIDIAFISPEKENVSEDTQHILENYLNKECQSYENNRNEPSALIVENAILLARYRCDMSPIFRHGISPRSAVILIFPKESLKQMPLRTEGWIKKDTSVILLQVAKQLGEPECIIEC
jgi:hypothetical protein